MRRDRFDLPLTTASDAAASAYGDGFDRLLAAWNGAEEALDGAIAADPDFALAHIARARIHATFGRGVEARACAARARELAAKVTDRERGHIHVIASAIEGNPAEALIAAEQHLDTYPRDALLLLLLRGACGRYAFAGRNDHDQARLAICERHARHYGEDWWFLAYHGWSNTEAGNPALGLEQTQRSLALRRENGHVAHALAHTYFELGDAAQRERFLGNWLGDHPNSGFMHWHLTWHQTLLYVEAGDTEGAFSVFNNQIRPSVSDAPPINVVSDGASLLWRLALDGHEIPRADWDEIAAYGDQCVPNAGSHFIDLHYVLAAAAMRDTTRLDRRLSELNALHAKGKLAPGAIALGLCNGARAMAVGDDTAAIRILEPLMPEVVRIGGSHAQRELWEDMLIVACLRNQKPEKARKLIDARLHRRPSARDRRWLSTL
jgi:tetratricopeptide (TPR) repeat protein